MLLILIGGVVPLLHYWQFIGSVPYVTVLETQELLKAQGPKVMLVDVRDPERFDELHIDGAINWPSEEIAAVISLDQIPADFKDRTLLMMCDGGVSSARAANDLRKRFGLDAFNVKGGMQSWIATVGKTDGEGVLFRSDSGEVVPPPTEKTPWYEQLALVGAIGFVKPLYTLIALGLIIALWRVRSSDLVGLRWAIVSFFLGEGFCAANILFLGHSSILLEFLHSYGMAVGFGFFAYALLQTFDLRVLNYSSPDKRCAALSLCHDCIKYAKVPCGLKRMAYFFLPVLIALAFIPMLANMNPISYNTDIFGLAQNLAHPVINQVFEIRYSPIYGIVLLSASLFALLLSRGTSLALPKVLFAAGMGFLGFGFLRLFFYGIYPDNLVWPNFWEELTELAYVSSVGFALWLFRRGLFQTDKQDGRLPKEPVPRCTTLP